MQSSQYAAMAIAKAMGSFVFYQPRHLSFLLELKVSVKAGHIA
jgi:hypothetical protein